MFRKLINLLFGTNYNGIIDLTPVDDKPEVKSLELPKPYTISQNGIDLIKGFEKLELRAYPDTGGVWTIGWGHTRGVKEGMTITRDQAEQFLNEYLFKQDKELNNILKDAKLLTQKQYDVICSFAFNIGTTEFKKSTFLKYVLNSQWVEAAEQLVWMDSNGHFHGWIFDNGKKIDGLINRRKTEQAIFLQGSNSTI